MISEAIGIVVTVLIIDRPLAWRERRRWRYVHGLYVAQAARAYRQIISAWESWLTTMVQERHTNRVTQSDKELIVEMGYHAFSDKIIIGGVEFYLGEPVGSKLRDFVRERNRDQIDGFRGYLVPYLVLKTLPEGYPSWSKLHESIDPPVLRLSDLIDKYSSVVDPELAKSVVRLSGDLDMLKSGEYERFADGGKSGTISVAIGIAEGILKSLDLGYCIKRYEPYLI